MKRIACINGMILQNFQIMLKMAMWSFTKGINFLTLLFSNERFSDVSRGIKRENWERKKLRWL